MVKKSPIALNPQEHREDAPPSWPETQDSLAESSGLALLSGRWLSAAGGGGVKQQFDLPHFPNFARARSDFATLTVAPPTRGR